jgi:phosphate acetyltransferase
VARSVYIASAEGQTRKSIIALGLAQGFKRSVERVGAFRPVVSNGTDRVLDMLKTHDTIETPRATREGVTYADLHQDRDSALEQINSKYEAFRRLCDAVVIQGSDYTDLPGSCELTLNATIAANLGCGIVLAVSGLDRTPTQVAKVARAASQTIAQAHGQVIAVVATRCAEADLPAVRDALAGFDVPTGAMAEFALTPGSDQSVWDAIAAFEASIDTSRLLAAIDDFTPTVVTPLAFQGQLLRRARADKKHIVLPEGEDDRVLRAAARVAELDAAEITILGESDHLLARAAALGLDLSGAKVVDPSDPELIDRFATEYAQIRAHKGMTKERAVEIVGGSATYFATMMVHLGLADGMVSGACHTTADTIRPSFEIIKTAPGTEIVSSVFLMAMADKVLVMGDCAVNPNPTPSQLASIAVSSAATAAAFGIDPRVALISYSTGTSGSGPDVDAVTAATTTAQELAPDLPVDGPLQYDAAVVASVAASKRPGSKVAGKATVLIFPDLNTGNAVYKAVQRSAGALAIGPVLQGLRKPVNDLSRGALVEDIVNTVIITACQAQ